MKRKWKWLLFIIPIILLLAYVIIFLIERSQVSLLEEEGTEILVTNDADSSADEATSGNTDDNLQEESMKAEVITAQEAKQIMDNESGYIILDVRESDEFEISHIDGAIQLSYLEIKEKAETVLPEKDQLILVYCRSGRRSAVAGEMLLELGYTNVKDFGGILDWPYGTVN